MKNFTKKIVTLALGSVMALSVGAGFAGCGAKERGPNEILMWAGGQWVGSDAENLKSYVKWYNENNDLGLTITLEIRANFETSFSGAVYKNQGPDIMLWDRFNTPTYASSENLEPITDLVASDNINVEQFNSTAYNEMSHNGVQYGLPLDLDLWGIYINIDIVNAYNEANPGSKITCLWDAQGNDKLDWTWDDLLDTAQKLKGFKYTRAGREVTVQSGYDGEKVNEFFIHNYFSTGEDYLGADGKAHINKEKGAATASYLHDLYKTSTPGYIDQLAFVNGTLAMYMRPTYFTSYLNTYAGNLNVRFMPQPRYPGEGGKNRGVMGGYGLAIPRPLKDKYRTEKWEAKKLRCWDFMKDWLYNEENMCKWAEISKTIPALLSTHDKESVTSNTVLKDAIPYSNSYTVRPGVPGWLAVQVQVFNSYIPTFCQGPKNDNTISDLLNMLEKETDSVLKDYGLGN